MQEPLFLKPVFQEKKIWEAVAYVLFLALISPNDKIGEDWAIECASSWRECR